MLRRLLPASVALAALLLARAACAAVEPAPPLDAGVTFDEVIRHSGAVGGLIFCVGLAALAHAIYRCYCMRRDRLNPPGLLESLERLVRGGRFADAAEACATRPSVVADAVREALAERARFLHSEGGLPPAGREIERRRLEYDAYQAMRPTVAESIETAGRGLERELFGLDFAASVAPLLGLFGTVTGMYTAFCVIAHATGQPTPADLARGISQALLTTIEGLMVAMPTLLVVGVFRVWIDRALDRLKADVMRVIAP